MTGITEGDVGRLTDYMERLLFKMKSIDRSCLGEFAVGLTFAEFQVIIFLGKNGPTKMSGIAGRLSMSMSNLTGIVDKLTAKELAVRDRSSEDRRVVVVRLLENGQRISRYHHGMKLELSREVLETLDAGERHTYMELMRKITENE